MLFRSCRLLQAKDLFVDESSLTGETFPAPKTPGRLPAETPMAERTNVVWFGSHVVSGMGRALVVRCGDATEFGKIAGRLRLRPPETDFERGVRRFGILLMEVTFLLTLAIFAVNVALDRPGLDSLTFSLALAIGLTPQLLPAVIAVNLALGSRRMAKRKVLVRRLEAIENFGGMEVLCSDKTGTLTEGVVQVHQAVDVEGVNSEKTLLYAYLNAVHESGFVNPIDRAIREQCQFNIAGYEKLDEIPYDFARKRLSIQIGRAHV